jgi:hypothetical protein
MTSSRVDGDFPGLRKHTFPSSSRVRHIGAIPVLGGPTSLAQWNLLRHVT